MIEQRKIVEQIEYDYTNYLYAFNIGKYIKENKIKNMPKLNIKFIDMQVKILGSLLPDKVKNELKKLAINHAKLDIEKIKIYSKYLK